MNRSLWKTPRLLVGVTPQHTKDVKNHVLRTCLRAAMISPDRTGQIIHVHNGHRFIPVHITEKRIGYKYGQFVLTKKRVKKTK